MIAISLLKMYVRRWHIKSRWVLVLMLMRVVILFGEVGVVAVGVMVVVAVGMMFFSYCFC